MTEAPTLKSYTVRPAAPTLLQQQKRFDAFRVEYCGHREHHEYQLYLAVEDIDHSKTRARRPQSNGICERFHKTMLQEFYQVAFRKKLYNTLDDLQEDLDNWMKEYNEQRPHSGKYCFGKTPMQTFSDSIPLAKEKMLNQSVQTVQEVA